VTLIYSASAVVQGVKLCIHAVPITLGLSFDLRERVIKITLCQIFRIKTLQMTMLHWLHFYCRTLHYKQVFVNPWTQQLAGEKTGWDVNNRPVVQKWLNVKVSRLCWWRLSIIVRYEISLPKPTQIRIDDLTKQLKKQTVTFYYFLFIWRLFKHPRQRAEATYMPVSR